MASVHHTTFASLVVHYKHTADRNKKKCAKACNMMYEVDSFLRWPVKKNELEKYSVLIDDLLSVLIEFCSHTLNACVTASNFIGQDIGSIAG